MQSRDREVLISGPAGTGKSRACLQKLDYWASEVPGSRHLIVRRTRESLTESGLVTFEDHVHPGCDTERARRRTRQVYEYPNGSQVAVVGLDKPSRVMSAEYDLVYVQEATEVTEEGWDALATRLRNNRLPFQQLLADCNPGPPTHWLKRRAERGVLRLIESRHGDNPRLHDGSDWTEEGRTYLTRLDALSGVRLQRLRHGIWAASDGLVYEDFDPVRHVVPAAPIPRDWPRFRSVDFGYTNPFVCQWWAIDPDGRLVLYREIYATHGLVQDHAARILALESATRERPEVTVTDHDAENRATLERYLNCSTTPADKRVTAGIQAVQARLRLAGDGRPRLTIQTGDPSDRDETLVKAGTPASTVEEFPTYVWQPGRETPLKRHDHGLDALRYAVMWADQDKGLQIFL
jgi:PBSX family phage terminase large subunit